MTPLPLWPVAAAIFLLMLPVTGVVPVLEQLTGGRHQGLGDFGKHLFMVSNMLAAFLAAPLVGGLSDNIGRRRPLIIAAMLANAVTLTLLAQDAPYAVHLILRFFDGALHITALTLLMALAADRAGQAGSGPAMGLTGASLTLGVALGAPLGGWIGQRGATEVLLAGAAISLGLAVWAALLREPTPTARRTRQRGGLVPRLPRPILQELVVPYVFTFADRLSVGFIVSTMTLYLGTVLGAEPGTIGLLMGSFMLPFGVLTYAFGRSLQYYPPLPMMFLGSSLYGAILIALALAPLPLWWLLMPVGGIAAALMFAPSLVLVARTAGEHARGRALGGFHAAGSLGFLLGPLVGGGILAAADLWGGEGWLIAFIAVASLQWLCVVLFLPRLRAAPTRPST